jgi:hypothetical protein
MGDGCSWARMRGLGGGADDLLASENASGPAVVEILPTDKGFTSSRCAPWLPIAGPITTSPTVPFGPGTLVVGVDVAPGTWRSAGGGGCYWARLKDFRGDADSILAKENPTGSAVVEIAGGDAGFTSKGCAVWSRSG